MKKLIAMVLIAATLMVNMTSVFAANQYESVIKSLGIMTGDENGNMNLTSYVTRAEFCKMLIAASADKDSYLASGSSVFSDVKSDHWANAYIRTAVDNGYINGYTDGSFKPENNVVAAEAYAMVLRLLGYDTTSLSGNFQTAIMNLAGLVGLTDGITNTGTFTRDDCVTLFYNTMVADTASGVVYATTLGYTVTDDEIDISSITSNNLNGPYVYSGTIAEFTGLTVYRDDELSSSDALLLNDVYYINTNTNTAYVYSDKVYGTISEINDNLTAPTSIVINGVSYTLGTNAAKYTVSIEGDIKKGELVTLLLGMNGDVVSIIQNAGTSVTYIGYVTSATGTDIGLEVDVICTDGVTRTFETSSTSYSEEDLVSVTVSDSITFKKLSKTQTSGLVSKNGIGSKDFASTVNIIDVLNGDSKVVYTSELVGKTLSTSDILYYATDSSGDITDLILNNATGDLVTYGYASDVSETSGNSISGKYSVYIDGNLQSFSTNGSRYNVSEGGVSILYDGNSISSMSNLTTVTIGSITGLYASSKTGTYYNIASDAQILLKVSGGYTSVSISDINTTDYSVVGFVDKYSAGGEIRVLLAN